jgi:hypothetical protein
MPRRAPGSRTSRRASSSFYKEKDGTISWAKDRVYDNPRGWRVFLDDCNLGVNGRLPRAEGITVIDKEAQ